MNRRNILILILLIILLIPACLTEQTPVVAQSNQPTVTPTPVPPTPEVARTPVPADTDSPIVTQRSPRLGENLALDGRIELVFDRPMDRESVKTAFTLQQAATPPVEVAGEFTWLDQTTLHFQPLQSLKRGAVYDVILTQEAAAQSGEPLNEPYLFRFETIGYLNVAQVIPAPNTTDLETNLTLTVIFDRPVVPLTGLQEMEKLPHPLTFEPAIEGSGQWLNTSTYEFKPAQPLDKGKTYTAIIAAGLEDPQGAILADDYIWQFSTKAPEPLQVRNTSPRDEATQVGIDTAIRVQFNYPIDPDAAIAAFRMKATSFFGSEVKGTFQIDQDTLTFTPDVPLDFDTTYRVNLAGGIGDAENTVQMARDFTWRFTTVPLPKIISTFPKDGDTEAPSYTDFAVTFSAPISMATVLPNLEFTPPVSAAQISTYWGGNNTLHISFGARPSKNYAITIKNGITDPYGNRIPRGRAVSFRTADLPSVYRVRYSDPIATYDATAPINLIVSHRNVRRLEMRLYKFPPESLPQLQQAWQNMSPRENQLVREWQQNLESPLNEQSFSLINLAETPGGTLEPGLYLLDTHSPDVEGQSHQRHVLVLSNLNLTMKTGPKEVLVWAVDMATGRPVVDLPLTFHEDRRGILETIATDRDGIARLRLEPSHHQITAFSQIPFAAIADNWGRGIRPEDFNLTGGLRRQELRAYLYTDRAIYRPGQAVHFKGVIRAEDDAAFRLAEVSEVQIVVRDVTGQELLNDTLPVSQLGTFNASIDLAEDANLGYYTITAHFAGTHIDQQFQVAAYRPPEFEVIVTPGVSEIQLGDSLTATVKTRYLFGGPLVDAPVRWIILAENYRFKPPSGGRYTFSDINDPYTCFDCWWEWRYAPAPPILNGSGQTDAGGNLTVELDADQLRQLLPYRGTRLTIEATATGPDNQFISGRSSVIVHPGPYYIGLSPRQYVNEAGEAGVVDLMVVDWQGNPLPGKSIKVGLYHRTWTNTFVQTEYGGHWETTTAEEPVDEVVLTTNDLGQAVATFTPPAGGSYHLIAAPTEPTSRSREVRSSIFIWVAGEEHVSWRRENHERITLVSDKLSYSVGETAEILIPSPFAGPHLALITVERGGILRHDVIELTNNSHIYRLPITEADIPNIYVSVALVKGRTAENYADFKVGLLPFDVTLEPKTLALNIEPDTDRAEPGQDVTYSVTATLPNGQPAAGAELSLDLVDKGILNLQPRTRDILNYFYARRALEVRTASSLTLFANRFLEKLMADLEAELEQANKAADQDQAPNRPAIEGEMAGTPLPMPTASPMPVEEAKAEPAAEAAVDEAGVTPPPGVEIREEFADTAFWEPLLITDKAGRAKATVTLPDNLTTWVMRGVGLADKTIVGEQTAEVVATKSLLIRPVTPRFFVVEDRAQLAANVNNNTNEALAVEVSLSAEGVRFSPDSPPVQTVTIPAGGETKVTWNVTVEDVTETQLIFSAVSGQYADAAKPRLTTGPDGSLLVFRYTAPDIVGTAGQLIEGGSRTETIALPEGVDHRRGELTVKLDPSLAAGMQDGLDYLRHFPYECTEQTVSRFLPNVLTFNALESLGIDNPELAERLPGLVETGLDKLYREQNPDGGWGWWHKPQTWRSNPHISAYVVFALLKAKQAGVEVSEGVLSKGISYLQTQVQALDKYDNFRDANRQAWLLYVLAEGDVALPDRLAELFDNREQASYYARAYLAQAIWLQDPADPRLATLLSDLNNAAIFSATGAHWEEDDFDWWAMNTDTRSTAIIIDTLTKLDPNNTLISNAVRWLMTARKTGTWETTQETAWALIALTNWMLETGELDSNYDYALYLNDDELTAGTATRATVREGTTKIIPIADLVADATNALTIARTDGNGRLYYTAHLKVFLPVDKIEPVERGIVVSRRYTLANCNSGQKCADVREAKLGDEIRVDLTIVAPHDLYYVLVEDPLPAGGEAIDTSLATTGQMTADPALRRQGAYWWGSWYSRGELRDEKVVLFADVLPKGTYNYSYTFRTTLPGDYHVIPTLAQEFYFPEVFGRSDGRLLSIGE